MSTLPLQPQLTQQTTMTAGPSVEGPNTMKYCCDVDLPPEASEGMDTPRFWHKRMNTHAAIPGNNELDVPTCT
jgi:hypothetical protein